MIEKSPYHGKFILIWIALAICSAFSCILSYTILNFQSKFGLGFSILSGTAFGFTIGSAFYTVIIIVGSFKGAFKNMIMRIIHFINNSKISMKMAWMLYKEEVVEQGLIFWITFPVGLFIYGVAAYSWIYIIILLGYL